MNTLQLAPYIIHPSERDGGSLWMNTSHFLSSSSSPLLAPEALRQLWNPETCATSHQTSQCFSHSFASYRRRRDRFIIILKLRSPVIFWMFFDVLKSVWGGVDRNRDSRSWQEGLQQDRTTYAALEMRISGGTWLRGHGTWISFLRSCTFLDLRFEGFGNL